MRLSVVLACALVDLVSARAVGHDESESEVDKRQFPGFPGAPGAPAVPGQPQQPALQINNACARASREQAQGRPAVDPSVALECLNSIPLDVERDTAFIDYTYPLISFESNLAWIKNPPAEYKTAAGTVGSDILGGLDEIKKKVQSGAYKSQYEFTTAVEALVESGQDGHFVLKMPLNHVFTFARNIQLLSISADGLSLPKLYIRGDFTNSRAAGMDAPSPIVKIDGMPIYEYLDNLTTTGGGTHDIDAGFNMLFPSLTKMAMGLEIADAFSMGMYSSLPDESSLELANGTIAKFQNLAVFASDLGGVSSPEDMHRVFELGQVTQRPFFGGGGKRELKPKHVQSRQFLPIPSSPIQQRCPENHGFLNRPDFWPTPFDQHQDKYTGGYFLDGEGYNDTAVLELSSFASPYLSGTNGVCNSVDMLEYHRFMKSFITRFRQADKKKLVIDLSVNGGGWETTLTDTFDQLFPGKVPGFWYRVRASPAMNWILNSTYDDATGQNVIGDSLLADLHKDWPSSFGPVKINGDNFTELIFRDALQDRIQMGMSDTVLKSNLLDPKDIVIITDGACHSSCALLVGWLTREMGIRTVAFGGRPTKAPMQAIGGTKGGAVYPWDNFQIMTLVAEEMSGNQDPPGINLPSTDIVGQQFASPLLVGDQSLNTMDIWHNFTVPVQYKWEGANCRLFFTEQTFQSVESMWKAAADVAWKGAKCAPGSTGNEDDTMSDKQPGFKTPVIDLDEVFDSKVPKLDARVAPDVRKVEGRPASELKKLVDQGPVMWINSKRRNRGVAGGLKVDAELPQTA